MLTVNGFCCTVYDPSNSQGREVPQHGKIVHPKARLADAWGALEDFNNLDTRVRSHFFPWYRPINASNIQNIPEECFFKIGLSRAGKPGSHPSDANFSPRPFEDINKDARVFIYMNGKLVDGPLNMDRLHPQFKNFPANRDAKYLDYDKVMQGYGSDIPTVYLDATFFNVEETCRRGEEGLREVPLESVNLSKELRDQHFFVEVVVVPLNVTAMPTPKAELKAIIAFGHLAHFRFIFTKTSKFLLLRNFSIRVWTYFWP
jgi:hypothetical protein